MGKAIGFLVKVEESKVAMIRKAYLFVLVTEESIEINRMKVVGYLKSVYDRQNEYLDKCERLKHSVNFGKFYRMEPRGKAYRTLWHLDYLRATGVIHGRHN